MQTANNKIWRRLIPLCVLLTLVITFGLSTSRSSASTEPSEQVIFSGVGFAGDGDWQGPVGFWIWCQPEGTGPYVGVCAGAMYVYSQGLTKGVHGFIADGAEEGEYIMTVSANDGSNFSAELSNELPLRKGPKSTIDFTVTTPAGTSSGSSTNSVVNVTGP